MRELNREAYEQGFVAAIDHIKEAMVEGVTESGQKPLDPGDLPKEQVVFKSTVGSGIPSSDGVGNLRDIVMKGGGEGQGNGDRGEDRFSHGPGSTTSGSGTSNY